MISCGGGVNSVAMIILLFKRGEIMPVVFADTFVEHPETYCYMDYFEREFMSKYGQKIIRLRPDTMPELYRKDIKGLGIYDYCFKNKMVPMGFYRYCTQRWKIEPLTKYRNGAAEYIGFAMDEAHRAKGNEAHYPLIEEGISRKGCIEIIQAEGLSVPIKSGCYFCPLQRISQWEQLYRRYPDIYAQAEALEKNAFKKVPEGDKFKSTVITLRPDGTTLEYLRNRFDSKGGDLFPDFDFEELTPCACML